MFYLLKIAKTSQIATYYRSRATYPMTQQFILDQETIAQGNQLRSHQQVTSATYNVKYLKDH